MPNHPSWDDPESPHYYEQPGRTIDLPVLIKPPFMASPGLPGQRGRYDDVEATHHFAEADLRGQVRRLEGDETLLYDATCRVCGRWKCRGTRRICPACARCQARAEREAAARNQTVGRIGTVRR